MDILEKIHSSYSQLTKKQRDIADYLLTNPEDMCYITLAQLSCLTRTSELALLRFCQKIGCDGFLDLKSEFREYTQSRIKQLSSSSHLMPEQLVFSKTSKETQLAEVCRMEADTLSDFFSSFHTESIISAAAEIKKAKRILIFAHDISKIPADFLKSRLHLLYFNSIVVDLRDLNTTQQKLHQLTGNDLVIFFSFPKYYYPMGSVAKKVAEAGAPILTITDSMSSPAAKYSHQLILCKTATKLFCNSMTMPMVLINLLTSWLVLDTIPANERDDFMDALSS